MEPNTALVLAVAVCLLASLGTLVVALRRKRMVRAVLRSRFLTFSLEAEGDMEHPMARRKRRR